MLTRYAAGGAVAAANHLAATAGVVMLERGGNAVDAAIAAGAVMAVTSPHMCGLGGDLFAVVAGLDTRPVALNASGRAGVGADPDRFRAAGLSRMPFQKDIGAVTVPGCVDGLVALHDRYAVLGLPEVLAPARRLAEHGFPVSPTLADASTALEADVRRQAFGGSEPLMRGDRLQVPGVARAIAAIAESGRAGFYEGAAGRELLELGAGEFSEDDLRRSNADWGEALTATAFGRRLWTAPPNSQGYLALAGAWIADAIGLPDDPADEQWAFVLIEAARQAGFDRVAVLHEGADGGELISQERLGPRVGAVRERASVDLADVYGDGGTTCVCAVDGDRAGISLIMSNAAGFGSHLVLRQHGIFLHNRGMGFSLESGHPAEYGPGRRPPHTLTPLVLTDKDGSLDTVLGTMGGDAQPQILLQLMARVLVNGEEPGDALRAPRWVLSRDRSTGFDVWETGEAADRQTRARRSCDWKRGLEKRGYQVAEAFPGDHAFGHAQMIRVTDDGLFCGAADPRSGDGACVGR